MMIERLKNLWQQYQKRWNRNPGIRLGLGYVLFAAFLLGAVSLFDYFRAAGDWQFVISGLIISGILYGMIVIVIRGWGKENQISPEIAQKLAEYKQAEEELHRVQGHLEELVRERTVELAALTDIGKALSSTLGVNELLQLVYKQTTRILKIENMYIALCDEEHQEVEFAFAHRVDGVATGSRQP